jgi:hypothetical protein
MVCVRARVCAGETDPLVCLKVKHSFFSVAVVADVYCAVTAGSIIGPIFFPPLS